MDWGSFVARGGELSIRRDFRCLRKVVIADRTDIMVGMNDRDVERARFRQLLDSGVSIDSELFAPFGVGCELVVHAVESCVQDGQARTKFLLRSIGPSVNMDQLL